MFSIRPQIVIATQSVEGNRPVMRLLKICAEMGDVSIITPQPGPDQCGGTPFRRIVPRREWVIRGILAAMRRAALLLPRRQREKYLNGFVEGVLGVIHQGINLRRAWNQNALQPALFIFDGAEFMTTGGKLARAAGAGTIYYMREMFPNQRAHYTRWLTAYYCRIESRECRAAGCIIVQHPLWGKLLRRRYGIDAAKFAHNTPSPEPEKPLPGSRPGEPLRLYYHGIFTNGRGLENLIKAVGLVPGVTLDLRGSGHLEAELRSIAAATGDGDRIRFLPPIPTEQLSASAAPYDLGVVSGTAAHLNGRMGAGMKLYENISAGIPLFGFRCVTLRYLVRLHGIGFTYDGDDVLKTAEVLRYCMTHRDEVAAARDNTVRASRSFYNSDHQYSLLRGVIAESLRASGVSPGKI